MSVQAYRSFDFKPDTLQMIEAMNGICAEYVAQGFRLTVRQLYYQLVARAVIPNTERSYKRMTNIANDARLAGLMDWDAIEDRTREFQRRSSWGSGNEILASCARQFHMDMWVGQERRVFVVVEKEALAGVLEGACMALDVPLLAARGYPSVTVLREFAMADLRRAYDQEQRPLLLHLGDHDPSGIDMTRDLTGRLNMFYEGLDLELKRIALNMDQIQEQSPPPNPAKVTDSRFEDYQRKFGDESWELDALTPDYLVKLVRRHVEAVIDGEAWDARLAEIEATKARLDKVAKAFR